MVVTVNQVNNTLPRCVIRARVHSSDDHDNEIVHEDDQDGGENKFPCKLPRALATP